MVNLFRATVFSIKATHRGYYSGLPNRRGSRTRHLAKTSLWMKVQIEDAGTTEVWVASVKGDGKSCKLQEKQLEERYTCLVGTKVLISRSCRTGTFFYEGQTSQNLANPD